MAPEQHQCDAQENNITIFEKGEFGSIRTIDINGQIWFVGKDVSEMLGYSNSRKAISDHCRGCNKSLLPSESGNQEYTIIPESDVWRLIIKSTLPKAEQIEKWIMEEVLPSIRKTGRYESRPTLPEPTKSFEHSILNEMEKELDARAYQLGVDNKKFLEIRKILLGHSTPELAQTVGELAERTPKEAQESDSKDSYREMIRKVVSEIEGNFDISRVARELANRGIAIPHGVISNVLHIMAKRKELIFKGKYKSRNRYSSR